MKRQQVRIIGGTLRSRRITFLEDPLCRPTPDRIRETLFNWLAPFIQNAVCLDLFAGSGALAFEAISRGAKRVTALEKNLASVKVIEEQAAILGIKNLDIVQTDARAFLQEIPETPFDILFLDPPYQTNLLWECFYLLKESPLIKSHTLIYFESNQSIQAEKMPTHWKIIRGKKAGQIYFYLAKVQLFR